MNFIKLFIEKTNKWIKFSDFEQLVGDKKRIEHFSCGHVIPKNNLIAVSMATGPTGVKFDFSYNFRDSVKLVNTLKLYLIKKLN